MAAHRQRQEFLNTVFKTYHCVFAADPCLTLETPTNGDLTCASSGASYYCSMSCDSGYAFPLDVTVGQFFVCSNDAWLPSANVPECTGNIRQRLSQPIAIQLLFIYFLSRLHEFVRAFNM